MRLRKDDLFAHLVMTGGAWIDEKSQENKDSGVDRLHADLMKAAALHTKERTTGSYAKRGIEVLIRQINAHLKAALNRSIESVELAIKLECMTEYVHEDELDGPQTIESDFINQPIFIFVVPELRIWKCAQALSAMEQLLLSEAYEHWSNWKRLQAEADNNDDLGSLSTKNRLATDIEVERDQYQTRISELPSGAEKIIDENCGDWHGASHGAAPTILEASMSSIEISQVAQRCASLASLMTVIDNVSSKMPMSKRKQCINAINEFHHASARLGHMSKWIQALANASTTGLNARRCNVCYKHLGPTERKFCADHKRTSERRAPSDTPYLRSAYQQRLEIFFRSPQAKTPALSQKVIATWIDTSHEEGVVSTKVHERLVHEVSIVMHYLRDLYQIVAPVYQQQISDHFMDMVEQAQRPFICEEKSETRDQELERNNLQKQILQWFTLANFFKTLYGKAPAKPSDGKVKPALFEPEYKTWKGCDPNAPNVSYGSMSYQAHALHLARIRCWTEAKSELDTSGYLDVEKARSLRESKLPDGSTLSYSEIANCLGSSKQAVAHALKESPGEGNQPPRKRVLKDYKNRILG